MANKPHILIVEDDVDMAALIQAFLEDDGMKVTAMFDGVKGLEAAQTKLPDLILLDMTLPSMNGTEVCRELKKEPSTTQIPIIFLTGHTDETDVVLALELGSEDYIKKPFNGKELVARVHVALRRAKNTVAAKGVHLRHGKISLDRSGFEVKWDDRSIPVTQSEFQILWLLTDRAAQLGQQPGTPAPRDQRRHHGGRSDN